MNATDYNEFTGSLPSKIGLLTGLSSLGLCKWKYLVDHLVCLKFSFAAINNLSVIESNHKYLMFFFTIIAPDGNEFNGSLPSEIGLLTGLSNLDLGKWKYLVDHLDCVKVFCIANHNLSGFDSHHK